jgi:hypothetical protein
MSMVGMKNYEDADAYNRSIPSNLCQPEVGPRVAKAIIADAKGVRPAHEVAGFFNINIKVRTGDVPWEKDPRLFLSVHAKNEDDFGVINPMDLECPNKTCNEKFKYEVQLAEHVQTCCNKDLVCACTKEYPSYKLLLEHHRRCEHHVGKRNRKAYDDEVIKKLDFA